MKNSKTLSESKHDSYRIAVIGATGYGGLQTIKLLKDHPNFFITYLGGNNTSGKKWNKLNPFLELRDDPIIQKPNIDSIADSSDFAILSLPNGIASRIVPGLLKKGVRILDLSADYRYRSLDLWKQIYFNENKQVERQDYDLCNEAIYGLSEWYKEKIAKASLVACPGCFPTSTLLGLLPFLSQGLVETVGIIVDAKTGTSGGGRSPKENLLLSEASESISPYGVIGHRHTSEMEQEAKHFSGKEIELQFTPHLVPMVRGLLTTVYARLRDPGLTAEDCQTVLDTIYRDNDFIKVLPVGIYPKTKWSRQTNKVFISVQVDKRNGQLVIMTCIDNLMKGQAGQAIQNLNIMTSNSDAKGLPISSFYP
tara:strand:+ start:18772 stop:19869 length:1098 start_codon:yes stop_codon:yes gene_type:complete